MIFVGDDWAEDHHDIEVQDATGFPLIAAPDLGTTVAPNAEDLRIVRALDPHNLRATIVRNNPAPRRG